MFNESHESKQQLSALKEELEQHHTQAHANQKQALEQQQQQQQQISALMQECAALKAKVLTLENDAHQLKEQSAATLAASAAAASARIADIESEKSEAVAAAQQQVLCAIKYIIYDTRT